MKRIGLLAMSCALCLCLLSCQQPQVQHSSSPPPEPSATADASQALSQDELGFFNDTFFHMQSNPVNLMFLTCEYTAPREIDLFQLFYQGILSDVIISQQEVDQLADQDSAAPNMDIVKLTAQEMDEVLQSHTGVSLDDTQKLGLDQFYYLDDFQAYYLIHSDTNVQPCTVTSGIHVDHQQVRLEYTKNDGTNWSVTLQEHNDGYLFVSNIRSSNN